MVWRVALVLGLVWVSNASAELLPQHRLHYQSLTLLRVNPQGLEQRFQLGYRYRLYDREEALFRTAYVGASVQPIVTPAFARLGVQAELEPLAILQLKVRWDWLQYFGVLNHLQSFSDTDGRYSDEALKETRDSAQTAGGWLLTLGATLQGKVGPVVFRSQFNAVRHELEVQEGHATWYDPSADLLAPVQGWTLTNDADLLLMLLDEQLIVGVRHNWMESLLPDAARGASSDEHTRTQRIGPLLAWRFFDEPGTAWNRPTVLLLLQWYLEHPHRTGQFSSQALPYVVLGFAFSGDLLSTQE